MQPALPFATGIALQEYLTGEEGFIRAHEEGCSHCYVDLSLPTDQAGEWSPARVRRLTALADGLGVRPIVHGNFRAPLATEIPEVRSGVVEYLAREVALAAELNGPLVVHGGSMVDPRPTESGRWSALQRFIEVAHELHRHAREAGVEIWIENLSHYPRFRPFTYVFTRYVDYVALRESLPDALFIFDLGHANVNQQPPLRIFREFAGAIRAVSVSDNDGRSDAHLGLGRGTAPVADFVAVLRETSWQGVIAFETRGSPVGDGVEALRDAWDQP